MRMMTFIAALCALLILPAAWAAGPAGDGISYTGMKVQIARVPVQKGVSFDDAAESLKLRANQHNMKGGFKDEVQF